MESDRSWNTISDPFVGGSSRKYCSLAMLLQYNGQTSTRFPFRGKPGKKLGTCRWLWGRNYPLISMRPSLKPLSDTQHSLWLEYAFCDSQPSQVNRYSAEAYYIKRKIELDCKQLELDSIIAPRASGKALLSQHFISCEHRHAYTKQSMIRGLAENLQEMSRKCNYIPIVFYLSLVIYSKWLKSQNWIQFLTSWQISFLK